MAAALRLLIRQHAASPSSPMLRSLFPAPYSKGERRCCKTVPTTMTDSTKSFLDKLKDLQDSRKSLQDMQKNLEEHQEMIVKALHDVKVANGLFHERADDQRKLLAKIRNMKDDCVETLNMQDHSESNMQVLYAKIHNMLDGCDKIEKMQDDYDKDWAIQEAKVDLLEEQVEVLIKERDDYLNALRRYHELERSTMEPVEKLKKVAKVGAAVGLVGGLLLILAKI